MRDSEHPSCYQIGKDIERLANRVSAIESVLGRIGTAIRWALIALIWSVGLFFNASLSLLHELTGMAQKMLGI